MTHYSYDEWMRYVKNELSEENQGMYENHLYSCDQCLDLYLKAVSEEEGLLPNLTNGNTFTDLVMKQVSETKLTIGQNMNEKRNGRKRFYQSPLFQYTIAAAMTILLMATGVFQSLTKYAENVQSPEFQKSETSVTTGLVDRTFAWMDSIVQKNR